MLASSAPTLPVNRAVLTRYGTGAPAPTPAGVPCAACHSRWKSAYGRNTPCFSFSKTPLSFSYGT